MKLFAGKMGRVTGVAVLSVAVLTVSAPTRASAQQPGTGAQPPATTQEAAPQVPSQPDYVFDMGKIVVVGSTEGQPGVGDLDE